MRTTQIDTLLNKIFDTIKQKNHLVQNQKKWFRVWVTSNYVNCSRRNQKQCKACLSYFNIGIVYCTCGHSLRKKTSVNRKFVKYTMDFLSVSQYVIEKGRLHRHRYGKKPGDIEYYLATQLQFHRKLKQLFFNWRVFLTYAVTVSGAGRIFFQLKGCSFRPGRNFSF